MFDYLIVFLQNINTDSGMKKILLLFVCALFAGSTFAQNLIENGRFEDGTKGWDVLLSGDNEQIKSYSIEQSDSYETYGLAENFAGINFVELDSKSGLQQTMETKKNQDYLLVFAYSHRPAAGDKQLIVSVNGQPMYTYKIANNDVQGEFEYKHIQYKAESEKTTIAFYVVSLSGDEDKGVLMTDVLFSKESEVDLDLYYDY